MNIYATLILATLVLSFLLSAITEYLNLRALNSTLPPEFKDVYSEEKYARSQEYTRVRSRFGLLSGAFGLALLLGFWFMRGFEHLDQYLRALDLHPIITGVLFIGLLVLGRGLLGLPFRLYSVFVIEKKFGFNRTTPGVFVMDMFKGLALAGILGTPILALILAFFYYAGPLAWLYCWGAVIAFSLLTQFIAPTWIMPLFNKFTPLPEGDLRTAIMNMARDLNFSLTNIFVIDGSKRSTKSNAFFTGFGRNKRIALYDTLVENHTTEELTAVLAHEIGHYKEKHILKGMLMSFVQTGMVFALLSVFLTHRGLYDAFFMSEMSLYAGLVFFGLLYSPLDLILSVLGSVISRKHEFEADRYAARVSRDPEAMVNALKKLSAHNLSNLSPHRWYVFLNYSHPPVLERIKAIRALASAKAAPDPATAV